MTTYLSAGQFGPEAVLDSLGNIAPLTPVSVYVGSTPVTLATLYTGPTMAATSSNPLNTDAYGNLLFWAAPGEYTIQFTTGAGTTTLTVQVYNYPEPQIAFRGHLATSLGSVSSTGWDVMALDTVDFDTASGWSSGTHKWTCPVTGIYEIGLSASVLWGSTAPTGSKWMAGVDVGGTGSPTCCHINEFVTAAASAVTSKASTDLVEIAAGTTVQALYEAVSGVPLQLNGDPSMTYLTIKRYTGS